TVKPSFTISFLCAKTPTFGALTTPGLAQQISIRVTSSPSGKAWGVQQNVQDGIPSWTLTPDASNQGVLAGGESLIVTIGNVISGFSIGPTADGAEMYGQHTNFPGYNDGYFSAAIYLANGPQVTSLFLNPVNLFGSQTAVPVSVTWAVANCGGVTIQGGNLPSNKFAAAGTQAGTLTNQPITLYAATDQSAS